VDRLASPLLRRLHGDWQAAAPALGLPGHDFIDPLKLSYLLGQLLIVGVAHTEAGGLRFHYRLVGTDVVARYRRDVTGRWMDEHEDPEIAGSGPLSCALAVEARQPVHVDASRVIDGKAYPIEYLLLPLIGDDGAGIDRLVIAQLYSADTPRVPYEPRAGG
jgi:hypothetical protein